MTDAEFLVLADELQQRGDPRGELIALQLAPETYASWARQRALIARHGRACAGPLATIFDADFVFERGECVGGRVAESANLSQLDAVLTTLVGGDEQGLELLESVVRWRRAPTDAIAQHGRRIGHLVELGFEAPEWELADELARAELVERLELVRLEAITSLWDYQDVLAMMAALAKRAGALRAVELDFHGWRFRFERERAPGAFTKLVAWNDAKRSPKLLAKDLLGILRIAGELRELVVEVGGTLRLPSHAAQELAALLDGIPLERFTLPWLYVRASATLRQWDGEFEHDDAREAVGAIWRAFHDDLGVPFDAYSVNDRGTPALTKDPVATIMKRAKPDAKIALLVKGTAAHVTISRSVEFSIPTARSTDDIIAWFVRALAIGATSGSVRDPTMDYGVDAYMFEGHALVRPGWLYALPAAFRPAIDATELGVRVVDCDSHVVFALDPVEATVARIRQLDVAVVARLDALVAAHAPAEFARQMHAAFDALVANRLDVVCDNPMRIEWRRGNQRLFARLERVAEDDWHVCIEGDGFRSQTYKRTDLAGLAAKIASTVAWFEEEWA